MCDIAASKSRCIHQSCEAGILCMSSSSTPLLRTMRAFSEAPGLGPLLTILTILKPSGIACCCVLELMLVERYPLSASASRRLVDLNSTRACT
jgi:hypothetical protein